MMKEAVHPDIVNHLDRFLTKNDSELWVIMEYKNGGTLTDVIENNPTISSLSPASHISKCWSAGSQYNCELVFRSSDTVLKLSQR